MHKPYIDNVRIINQEKHKKIHSLQEERWGKRYIQYKKNWENARKFDLNSTFPLHIDLDSTDACNLNCPYCWAEGGHFKRTNKRMPNQLIDEIFQEINSANNDGQLCALNIGTIGEPLLCLDVVYNILERSVDAGLIDKFIHTNAHLLTIDVFRNLVDLDLTYLLISLDAIREETYEKVRGKGFNNVLQNIEKVIEYKREKNLFFPIIRVSFVENDINESEKNDFIHFFKDKVDFVEIQPLVKYNYTLTENKNVSIYCHQPYQRMLIGLQGQMALCCSGYSMLRDFYVAKFPEMPIKEAWLHEKSQKLRYALKENELTDYPYCLKCLQSRKKPE